MEALITFTVSNALGYSAVCIWFGFCLGIATAGEMGLSGALAFGLETWWFGVDV